MLDNAQHPGILRPQALRRDAADRHAAMAAAYADDAGHARRLADYMDRGWFLPSAALMAEGGALPLSCVVAEPGQGVDGVVGAWNDIVRLARFGAGACWGNLPAAGEGAGVVPLVAVADSLLSAADGPPAPGAAYLPMSHPEIAGFISAEQPRGALMRRGVLVPNAFMRAVEAGEAWVLRSPDTGGAVGTVPARALWSLLMRARGRAGAPHVLFADHLNNGRPEHQKLAGLQVRASSPDGAAALPTGPDHHGRPRTPAMVQAVLNLEHWMEWHGHLLLVEDVMRFLDNALQHAIDGVPASLADVRYALMRERSVGLGVAGFHAFLQSQGASFESVVAKAWNKRMFRHIRAQADGASRMLAEERGACPDSADYGTGERFSNKLALSPHHGVAEAMGTSAGVEPWGSNAARSRNVHLRRLLAGLGRDTDATWASIEANGGSAAHLASLTDHQRAVFRTAREVSPASILDHAADRASFVCQCQPVRLYLKDGAAEQHLHDLHALAWRRGLKSLAGWTDAAVEDQAD